MSIVPQHSITIAGVEIAQDQSGRFCLNDLHKAGGNESRHQPALFFRRPEIAELVVELNSTPAQSLCVSTTMGRNGGTYVCRELVYAYAMWISAKFHLEVIRTFDGVANGQLPVPVAPVAKQSALSPAKEFRALFGIARLIGLDKNAAAISANQGTTTITGTNMLALIGQTHLVNEHQEICFTPTELGSRLCMSAKAFNRRLSERGMQQLINARWVPTDQGMQHAVILDTGKKHGSGTPVQQVKWRDSVMSEVTA